MNKLPAETKTLSQKIAMLREETGTPERVVREMRCSRERKRYWVVFERFSPAVPFKVKNVIKEGDKVEVAGGEAVSSASSKSVSTYMLDESGLGCPWCNDRRGNVSGCDCGNTWCGHGKRKEGKVWEFSCPVCNVTFELEKADRIAVRDSSAGSKGAKSLLSGVATMLQIGRSKP